MRFDNNEQTKNKKKAEINFKPLLFFPVQNSLTKFFLILFST